MAKNRLEDLFDELGIDYKVEKAPVFTVLAKIGKNVVVIEQLGIAYGVKFLIRFDLDDLFMKNFEDLRNWIKEQHGTTN